jgi:cyanophycin synthetase
MQELESMTRQAQPGSHTNDGIGDPDLDAAELEQRAIEEGDSATAADTSALDA